MMWRSTFYTTYPKFKKEKNQFFHLCEGEKIKIFAITSSYAEKQCIEWSEFEKKGKKGAKIEQQTLVLF